MLLFQAHNTRNTFKFYFIAETHFGSRSANHLSSIELNAT